MPRHVIKKSHAVENWKKDRVYENWKWHKNICRQVREVFNFPPYFSKFLHKFKQGPIRPNHNFLPKTFSPNLIFCWTSLCVTFSFHKLYIKQIGEVLPLDTFQILPWLANCAILCRKSLYVSHITVLINPYVVSFLTASDRVAFSWSNFGDYISKLKL